MNELMVFSKQPPNSSGLKSAPNGVL
jgi:hypothetical protein